MNDWNINKPEEIYLLDLNILNGKTISYYALTKVCDLIAAKHVEEIENFWDLDISISDGDSLNKLQIYKDEGLEKPSLQTISISLIIDDIALNALNKHDYGLCYIAEYMHITLMISGGDSLAFLIDYLSKPADFPFTKEGTELYKVLFCLKEKELFKFKSGQMEETLLHYFLGESKVQDALINALVLHRKHDSKYNNTLKSLKSF